MDGTAQKFKEQLYKIEAESGIFDLEVDHIRLWQYVRWFCLAEIVYDVTGVMERARFRRSNWAKNQKIGIKEWIMRQPFLLGRRDLIVFNHSRRVKEGKYYRCFVTETLLENLDCSYYVFEEGYYGVHFRPTTTKNLKYIDMSFILKNIKKKNSDIDQKIRIFFDKIMQVFEKENGIELSVKAKKRMYQYILYKFYEMHSRTVWAKLVFSVVRPKAVIVVSPYTPDIEAIIVEAKKRNITTIELQHGIDLTHIAYNYLYKGKIDVFSDYFFAYGKYDKEIPRYPIDRNHVIAAGYPDLEIKAEYYKKIKKQDKKVILFISGDGTTILPDYAVELRKREELKDFRMIYKLHPDEYLVWKKLYPQLLNSGVEIISKNSHDIYYYLGHADYVIGISSTALYQATAFEAEIFIIKGGRYEISDILYENGFAQLVTDADMIVDKILKPVDGERTKESYFEKNAIEIMKRELDRILASNGNGNKNKKVRKGGKGHR